MSFFRSGLRPVRASALATLLVALAVLVAAVSPADGAPRPPRLRFATFFGGSGRDTLAGAVLDGSGDVLLTGHSSSQDFPVVNAAWPERPSSSGAAFVAKIHSSGSRVLFSTYLPVDGFLAPSAITTDADGNIYLVGWTSSPDLPLVNPVQDRQGTDVDTDAFLMKLSPDGSEILMSTYLGGSGQDIARAVVVDESGVAYLTGYTASNEFPAERTFGRTDRRRENAFVVGIDTRAGSLTLSVLLAGERFDAGNALALDDDSIWVGGVSTSRAFPVRRAVRRNVPGGNGAFVARIGLDGPRLLTSTRLFGGTRLERVEAISLDVDGDPWVVGRGGSRRMPVTGGQEGLNLCPDLGRRRETSFLVHLDRRGRRMHASGCVTPGGEVIAQDLEVLPDGKIAVVGGASGDGLPLRRSLLSQPAGKLDVFIAILDPVRKTLDLSSLYGARRSEFATDLGVGPDGRLVVAGQTGTKQFPVVRALQPEKTSRAGVWDTFLLKIRR